jgi:murein tripeptide amidase MpaA
MIPRVSTVARVLATLAALALATPPFGPATPVRASFAQSAVDSIPAYWRTRAERTGYRRTSDYQETMRTCRSLEGASRWVRLVSYGKSGQGRDLPLLIVSKDRAFTPGEAQALGKPIVLIQNGIHSGEIEGKDASLALVRDMVVTRTRESLLDRVTLLVLPIFSVDAHERSGPYNRINQNGPDEMGWRATPIGLNLNRDYVKAESPEMQALLSEVFTRWWPHLLVDDHTTDGADYRHDVTYSFNHGPMTPAPVARWLTEAFEGRVVPRLAAMGHLPAPYLTFKTGNEPRSGIQFDDSSPRYSTGYAPIQGRPGLLVETHMLKPYASRVKATYDLLVALLEEVNAHPEALVSAVAEAESEIVARGRSPDPARREVVLLSRLTDRSVPFDFKGVATRWEPSDIAGRPVPRYSEAPWDTVVPLYRDQEATVTVRQPVGYLVPQEWTTVLARLTLHGVRARRFARAWTDSIEQMRIESWKNKALFEGHLPDSVLTATPVRRSRTWRPGDWWVPLDQRAGLMAVHLLEPQAPDGLFVWNVFDTILQRKEYAEDYVIEPIARGMLRDDPALAREFQARLRTDSAFAGDPAARLDFFYRRSPWADPEQNLIPVARALHRPPETVLAQP